ncbi:hypothetical protein [Vibrio gallaecicus]|uniref:hypothetical protein n=1 Tax=Vibrio gallaecicus TaxID=552386 RepID=UPI0025B35FCF|nr:hypothetical protein [Vibrio gallaecicus]MDN3617277.1 hypothetical protein [Vibrio gallaecicus]
MAFSTRFSFSDLGVKFECIGSVVSYLIGRYVLQGSKRISNESVIRRVTKTRF